MHVVLVEDNESLRKGLVYRLSDDGHVVDALSDGQEALLFLQQEDSDIVILDINLPGKDGLEILTELRRRKDPRPVILLTARSTLEDRVLGLDAGADDYLVKPFEMEELAARVRALARRKTDKLRTEISFGPLVVDLETSQALLSGNVLNLPRRELALLIALMETNGAPVSKDALLNKIYGIGTETDEKVVEVYVSRLRKRLALHKVTIQVARGIGYSLVETI